jgi:hypothetical protein
MEAITVSEGPKTTPTADALRAWAPMVSSGYVVPAAGQAMLFAADQIDQMRALLAEMRALLAEAQDVIEAAADEQNAMMIGSAVEKRKASEIILKWEERVRAVVPGIWK